MTQNLPGGPTCPDEPQATQPGWLLRAVAGVCYVLPLLTFALCLAVMLLCVVSLVAGLFAG
jgi:hypothetical protein